MSRRGSYIEFGLPNRKRLTLHFILIKNPLLSQKELIEWSQHKFDMKKTLSKAAMSKLFKDKERLLKVAATETSHYVLNMKTKQAP